MALDVSLATQAAQMRHEGFGISDIAVALFKFDTHINRLRVIDLIDEARAASVRAG